MQGFLETDIQSHACASLSALRALLFALCAPPFFSFSWWFAVTLPLRYLFKHFATRRLSTVITVAGIALVIFIFAAVLMMADGVQQTLIATGSPDNVVIVRKGSNGEITSIISGEAQNVVATLPYIATLPEGQPIVSDQPVVVINIPSGHGTLNNVTLRGVTPSTIMALHPNVKLIEGKMFDPALPQVIIGKAVAKMYPDIGVGSSIKIGTDHWKVVGIFSSGGTGFDSEIWGDETLVREAFDRGNYVSSITLRLDKASDFPKFKEAFQLDKRLEAYQPTMERDYYKDQSEALATFIRILGVFVTVIFSVGAAIGAMITMYAEVANRTVEIGTMRALGFGRTSILAVFLFEGILISLVGGAIGILLASFLRFVSISTMNYTSFSELSFSFTLTPSAVWISLAFSVVMGFIGGFLPSARAARMNIVAALRGG